VSDIDWSDDWRTGVDWIDAQHRELVLRLQELFDGIANGSAEVLGLLDRLIEGTTLHFKDEEAEMLRSRYPFFEDHRREHIELAAQIMETPTRRPTTRAS
jgi:hemerythrin